MPYRERLLPPWWVYVLCLLVVPAAVLVFLPIDPAWGVAVAAVLFLAAAAAFTLLSPTLEVADGEFRAGRARIPVSALGPATPLDSDAMARRLRTGYDAAAFHCTVPWVTTGLVAEVTDASDPTTCWVIATRRPATLARALGGSTD